MSFPDDPILYPKCDDHKNQLPDDAHFTKTVKTCKVCLTSKPITAAYFQPHSNSPDGFTHTCNDCRKKNNNRVGRPKKSKTLAEVFNGMKSDPVPPLELQILTPLSKEDKIKLAHEMTSPEQEALELIESLFPDGIQPRQYKGMLKTIKLILKTAGQI